MSIKKYKVYTKVLDAFSYPSRILKFKRTKWFNLKTIIQKKVSSLNFTSTLKYRSPLGYKKKDLKEKQKAYVLPFKLSKSLKLYNKFKILAPKGRFLSIAKLIKSKALLKVHLKNVLHLRYYSPSKSSIKNRELYIKSLYSHGFSLHGVFSYFYFVRGYRELQHLLKSSNVFVNDNPIYKTQNLKRGDIVQLKTNKPINVDNIIKSFVCDYKLPSHLEMDIYSQTIVLLKDQKQSCPEDYTLSTLEYINGDKL